MPIIDELNNANEIIARIEGRDLALELRPGERIIGRAPDCDLVIDDPLISRHHAKLCCGDKDVAIEDLGSRNGSRVNGSLIRGPTLLEHDDRLQFGSYELTFRREFAFSEVRIPVARRVSDKARGDVAKASSEARSEWTIAEQITLIAWVEPGQEESSVRWPLEMLIELLGKAILSGRKRDVLGIMEQAVVSVERALEASESIQPADLEALRDGARWLSKIERSDRWLRWIEDIRSANAIACSRRTTRS